MAKKCIRCIISGRVQGVFFRDSTRTEAARLGVTGWVRNCRDGTVEVVAGGEQKAVDTLRGWLAKGPPHARVTGIECSEVTPTEDYQYFEIR